MSESAGSIQNLLTRHALVAIDSSILIYVIAGDPGRAEGHGLEVRFLDDLVA